MSANPSGPGGQAGGGGDDPRVRIAASPASGQHPTGQTDPPQAGEDLLRGRPELSSDEQRILRECNKESLVKRAIPVSIVSAFGTFAACQRGLLKLHPRFGAAPKVFTAAALGYFVGKFSYANVCAEKVLREIPDSNLANIVRARRGLPTRDVVQQQQSDQEEAPLPPSGYVEQQQLQKPSSYDALRKQHREQGRSPSSALPGAPSPLPDPSQDSASYAPPSKLKPRGTTNKYGDEGFE